MKNLYNNLSNREKKLIIVSLSLLVILIVFWRVNTVALKISVLKNQYQTSSSEYSYVLNKAKIISRSLESLSFSRHHLIQKIKKYKNSKFKKNFD